MPCYDDPYPQSDYNLQEKVDDLTRMLCSVCNILDSMKIELPTNEIDTWWRDHQKWDKARRAKEKRENEDEKALAKLTATERKLLGLG